MLPPLMVKIPSIVGTVEIVTIPVLILILLNVIAVVPFIVPTPTKFNVPVPLVNVPLFVKKPASLMFNVAAALQLNVPLFTKLPAMMEAAAPVKVNTPVPFVVIAFVTVPIATVALAVAVIPVLTVIELIGVFVNAAVILNA